MRALSIARLLLGLILSANGMAMLAGPEIWYLTVPGVSATGPFNPHFVRDIGCAYLVSGAALLWLARAASAWPAALAGSAFLLLHAGVHLGEAAFGLADAPHLLRDFPGVFLVPVLSLWLAWPRTLIKENHHVTMDRTAPARRL